MSTSLVSVTMARTLGVLMAALIIRRSTEGDTMRSPFVQRSTRHRHAAEISMKLPCRNMTWIPNIPHQALRDRGVRVVCGPLATPSPMNDWGDHTGDVLAERLWQLQRPFV